MNLRSVRSQHILSLSLTVCYHRGYPVIMFLTQCGCQHPAQDCAVSDWSIWSGCAKPCQPSVRVRVRHIQQRPSNSGEPCPSLEQRSGCREYRDHQGKHCGYNTGIQIHQHAWFYYICNCSFMILILDLFFPSLSCL